MSNKDIIHNVFIDEITLGLSRYFKQVIFIFIKTCNLNYLKTHYKLN